MSLGEKKPSDTLGDLQGKGDKFTKLALMERKRMLDLQDAIDYITKETEKYRGLAKKSAIEVMNIHVLTPNPAYQRADGVNIGKEAQIVTSKTLIVLEGKVNKLLQRKSELLNHNKKMKESINHFRLLRIQTDISHAKMEAVLREEKEKIEAYLAESAGVCEERDRLVEKKDAMERLNAEEQRNFQDEFEEMGRFIKEQNDALEYSLLQERKADRKEAQAIKNGGPTAAGSTFAVGGATDANGNNLQSELTLDEEVQMAQKVGSLSSFISAEQNSLSGIREKIASYETMFEQLKKMTGVESLEDMVSNYIAHEEEMFSLYNFIQTMNTEIDTVLESTAQTEADIVRFKEDQQDQDQQRRSTLDELQQRLANTREITSVLDDQNQIQQESVSQISKKVSSLFYKLQCDQMDTKGSQVNASKSGQKWTSGARPESKIALLTGQGVSESNVLEYLGCIEQRAVDILTDYLRLQNNLLNGSHHSQMKLTPGGLGPNHAPRSPTPGPATPMHWHGGEPLINLDDLSDDDLLFDVGGGDSSFGGPSSGVAGGIGGGGGGGGQQDPDNKPIDLSTYKSKLQKKLGLRDTQNGTASYSRGIGNLASSGSGVLPRTNHTNAASTAAGANHSSPARYDK